ncbi:protein CREG1 [Ceratina calcarata]|uniref:Protein CREG1 n=1 Tax=Ceratina calcarata TaxID=156304 RepID=A0AAJ7IUK5_9HYME|nr:protein CREG1 [Ceratina calcarata]
MSLRFAVAVAVLIVAIEAKKYYNNNPEFSVEEQWQEFEEFLKWKKLREAREDNPREIKYEKYNHENHDMYKPEKDRQIRANSDGPPPIDQAALMARYIVNQADWVPVSTISTRKDIQSFPAVTLVSHADGILGNGTGIPYLYLTPLDFTAQDLAKDNRASVLLTLAQGDYCKSKKWDPMDPRCARVLMSGRIVPLKNDSAELDLAKKVFFERHPGLVGMPADHHFYFAKLKIMTIAVLDTFGGPKYVSVKDYLHPPIANITEEFNRRFPRDSYEGRSQDYNSNMLNPVVRSI